MREVCKRDNALLAKTLVEAREHVPIRLLNVSNNVTTIRAGTIVGEISPVEDVITMTGNTSKETKNPKLDNELQKLVNEASSHLTEKQRHQVTNYDSLEQLAGNKWFSTLDLCSGYWQVEVEERYRPKTAFATRRGLFQFRKMPFRLACAPATFERLMERVMAGLQWNIFLVYLDDIIVVGRNFEEMLTNLRQVFDRLIDAGLKLKPKSVRCSQNQCPSLDM
ncbi:unnamed protein product [Mytilus coruscus]|uniref:Reverse transcriptase domain-containing protein n=1 Tax=Mytilus coruscus TaxID=42192 RepID=A0A6J8AI22_MYTCO|nr:unnamed protein product [Mytilus coruscus]